jgi:hypothetical protein
VTVGPILFTFASPFFIFISLLLALAVWHFIRRNKRPAVPHSYGVLLTRQTKNRLLYLSQISLLLIAILSVVAMLIASLNPQLIKSTKESFEARRIMIVCDISGSMTIGFEEGSPLPTIGKTRLGHSGKFMKKMISERSGDAFALVCFDTVSYVARDFTSDTSQTEEFLTPTNLVGILEEDSLDIPESIRIKERAAHEGTWAMGGIRHAREFIVTHEDYTGEEILIYLGDLESQSGRISAFVAQFLQEIREKDGILTYAVVVTKDYSTRDKESAEEVAKIKFSSFSDTSVPVYAVDNPQDIDKIARAIARDIPKTSVEEEIISRKSLSPLALLVCFVLIVTALVINEKIPRIP